MADDEPLPDFGPKMLALANDKQRRFVAALYDEDAPLKGDGLLIWAAREAGYGTGESTNKTLSVVANRLVHCDRVREAIAEYSRNIVRAISPEAVRAVRNLIRDPKAKDHARAAAMILDRVVPLETTHTVRVEDVRPSSPADTQRVLDRIEELMLRVGLARKLPPLIDAEFQVVTEGAPA